MSDVHCRILRRRDLPGCGSSPVPSGPPGPRPPGPAEPGRRRAGFRFVTGGLRDLPAALDGSPPTGRTLTRLRPLAGRSLRNCGPYPPPGHDASPGHGARYGRGSPGRARRDCRCGPSPSWISPGTWKGVITMPGRDGVPGASGRRSPGDARHRLRVRSVSRPAALLCPYVYRVPKRDRCKLRPKVLTNRCRAVWRIWPSPMRGSHGLPAPARDERRHLPLVLTNIPGAEFQAPREFPDTAADRLRGPTGGAR